MEQMQARTSSSASVSSSLFLDSPLSLGFTTRRSCPSAATGVKFEVKKIKKEEKEAEEACGQGNQSKKVD